MLIFLIGMPGSGKSTLGQKLASALQRPFIDLDERIEEREGQTIAQLLQAGEGHFRECEATALRLLHGNAVVATGGGTPAFHENMEWMNHHGFTLWLDVPLPTLALRLHRSPKPRPLFAGATEAQVLEKLTERWPLRQPFYQQAALHLNGSDLLVANLVKLLKAKAPQLFTEGL